MFRQSKIKILTLSAPYAKAVVKLLNDNNIPSDCIPEGIKGDIDYSSVIVNSSQFDNAARIIESALHVDLQLSPANEQSKREVIIPVDYTSKSIMGCRIGFALARRLSLHPVLIHAYSGFFPENESIDPIDTFETEVQDANNEDTVVKTQESLMLDFVKKLEKLQEEGTLLPVKFSYELIEGMPEESIIYYAKNHDVMFIAMATRSSEKRTSELVGSVTAEVLDLCRTPLFTMPENCSFSSIEEIEKICFFSNLDKQDYSSMETFLSLFEYPRVEVTVIPVTDKFGASTQSLLDEECENFKEKYPSATFNSKLIKAKNFRSEFKQFCDDEKIQLFVVQNKKRNIFKRLISPGVAHMLFFERDLPMIVIPT